MVGPGSTVGPAQNDGGGARRDRCLDCMPRWRGRGLEQYAGVRSGPAERLTGFSRPLLRALGAALCDTVLNGGNIDVVPGELVVDIPQMMQFGLAQAAAIAQGDLAALTDQSRDCRNPRFRPFRELLAG